MAFVKSNKTQKELLISYLRGTGRGISAAQANAMFGVKNLRARMSELRQEGFTVRKDTNKEGNTTYFVSRRKAKVV
ncbi:hypothetical protein EBS02_05315 [bacterium]|nr:hypothetical protein [bacterium]